jgi:hypothetical protein
MMPTPVEQVPDDKQAPEDAAAPIALHDPCAGDQGTRDTLMAAGRAVSDLMRMDPRAVRIAIASFLKAMHECRPGERRRDTVLLFESAEALCALSKEQEDAYCTLRVNYELAKKTSHVISTTIDTVLARIEGLKTTAAAAAIELKRQRERSAAIGRDVVTAKADTAALDAELSAAKARNKALGKEIVDVRTRAKAFGKTLDASTRDLCAVQSRTAAAAAARQDADASEVTETAALRDAEASAVVASAAIHAAEERLRAMHDDKCVADVKEASLAETIRQTQDRVFLAKRRLFDVQCDLMAAQKAVAREEVRMMQRAAVAFA